MSGGTSLVDLTVPLVLPLTSTVGDRHNIWYYERSLGKLGENFGLPTLSVLAKGDPTGTVSYDKGCQLDTFLKRMLGFKGTAFVPSLHSSWHNLSCRCKYSPEAIDGLGFQGV